MAKSKKKAELKKAAKPKAAKKSRKAVREDSRGMGDNINAIRKLAEPFMKRLFALQERMESDMGGYRSDFGELYEKASNEIGCKPAVLKREFRRALARKKELEAEADMDSAERDQVDALRVSMEGTQFEMFFVGDLALPSKDAVKAEKEKAKADAETVEDDKVPEVV